MLLKAFLLFTLLSTTSLNNAEIINFHHQQKFQQSSKTTANYQSVIDNIANEINKLSDGSNNLWYSVVNNEQAFYNLNESDQIKNALNKNSNDLNRIIDNYINNNESSIPNDFNINNITYGVDVNKNLVISYVDMSKNINVSSIADKIFIKLNASNWFVKQMSSQNWFSFDANKYNLNNFFADELKPELILKNLAQFQDNHFVGKYQLFKSQISLKAFIDVYNPKIIIDFIKNQDGYNFPYENVIRFRLKITQNNNTYISPDTLIIFNLKPKFNLTLNYPTIDLIKTDNQLNLSYLTADEFKNSFFENVKKLIFNNYSDYQVFNTNILESDFTNNKFKPQINIGIVDNINGLIKNNYLKISLPKINYIVNFNKDTGSPISEGLSPTVDQNGIPLNCEWTIPQDFTQTIKINFNIATIKQEIILNVANIVNEFDISTNQNLNQISASKFDIDFFKKYLVNYNSSFLSSNYLISINTNLDYFNSLLKEFKILNFDNWNGKLEFKIAILDPTNNNVIINKQYKLKGFRKTINISQLKNEVNINTLTYLNKQLIQNNINENINLKNVITQMQINQILNDQLIFKYDIDPNIFINDCFNNEYEITYYKNFGYIQVKIKLLNYLKNNPQEFININLNGSQLINNELILKINGFNKNIKIDLINNQIKGCDFTNLTVENFLDNSSGIKLDGFNLIGYNSSNSACIKTNLSIEEFKILINSINIEKTDYGYCHINITFNYVLKEINLYLTNNNSQVIIDTSLFNKIIDANLINEIKNLSVDDIKIDNIVDLFKFNPTYSEQYVINNQKNQSQPSTTIGTLNCSKDIFWNCILDSYQITKNDSSLNVAIALKNANGKINTFNFEIINLKQSTALITLISIITASSIVGLILIVLLILVLYRYFKKQKVLKNNKWDLEDNTKNIKDLIGDQHEK